MRPTHCAQDHSEKVVDLIKLTKIAEDDTSAENYGKGGLSKASTKALEKQAKDLEKKMKAAAKQLDFELAAELRDQLILLKGEISKRHER